MFTKKVKIFFLTCFAFAVSSFALDVPANKLVDSKWLNDNLNDPNLVIVDMRTDKNMYKESHIPGALHWAVDDFRESRFDLPGFIASPTDFTRLIKQSGITPDDTVVFYSDGRSGTSYTVATLALHVSEYYGLTNTAVLNGGFAGWVKDGFEVSKDPAKPKKSEFKITKFNKEVVATVPDVDEAIELKNAVVIDGRNAGQYSGEEQHKRVKKPGHMEEAPSVFIGDLTKEEGGVFYINSDKSELEKILSDANIDLSKPTIWYCNTGWFASGGWFVTKYILGLENTKVYEASMVEYSQLPKRKVLKSK